jgi:tRNA-specific 2-thiouridylase
VHDARRVSDALGIPHYAFDRRELFAREVVTPFVDDYLDGITPSPCVRCNRGVKTAELLSLADRLEADTVATGHYARLVEENGAPRLYRGRDADKDQSYFLHMLPSETLRRLHFPLGDMTKPEVRALAVKLGLPGAHKGESQELCFVPTGRYDSFVSERADGRTRPGAILNDQGQKVGEHDGIHNFTIGQRKNLGVSLGHRAYVTNIDKESGAVELGPPEALSASACDLREVSLADDVALPIECEVAVRYRGTPYRARVEAGEHGGAVVRFAEPVRAVVPGQVAVLFRGDRVLGGGTISSVTRTQPARRVLLSTQSESAP